MDRMLNSKREKDSIYEIYRACRLCGGGAGYKMPIIQNIVDLDEADVELKQKIRDCVQIEVHQDDKMPPLICELCVDKVNDFYEFLEMCRQTNKRTRLRLGLPPQSLPRGAPDAGDCILGLTEPVFVNEDSDGEPLSKHKKLNKNKAQKEPVVRIKLENLQEERSVRQKTRRSKTPPRVTRHSKSKDDDVALSTLQDKQKSSKMAGPKSILKKENSAKPESSPIMSPRLKRSRDKEPVKLDTPSKKVKITVKPPPPQTKPKLSPRLSVKSPPPVPQSPPRQLRSPAIPVKKPPPPPTAKKEDFSCSVCGQQNKSSQARGNHLRSHVVTFTNEKLACNPCGEWFSSPEETAAHHKHHKTSYKPYSCRKCQADFKRITEYDQHLLDNECLPSMEVPDVKCDVCWHTFPTNNLLEQHKCLGADHRPGGKCNKCKRSYALLKNLQKHESTCTAKKKGELIINKELLDKIKPIQVRVARCDPLLTNVKQEHYDVSTVTSDYGLDSNCYYPYIGGIRIKSEFPGMVDIQDEIKREFCSEDYIHWDSTDSEGDEEEISCDAILNPEKIPKKRSVESLSALTLKIIFSQRLLGKVPKKKRKLKAEKVFDSLLNDHDDVRMDIGSLIDNLGDDDDKNDSGDVSNLSENVSNVSKDGNVSKINGDRSDINVGVDNDTNDNSSQVSNNDIVDVNDSSVSDLNKSVNTTEHTNSLDIDKNNSKNLNKVDAKNIEFDDSYLDNISQDSNSQSLLESDLLKSDSESNMESTKNQNESQDSSPSNFNSKNDNLDSKTANLENSTAAKVNDNLEFNVKVQNNDLRHNNDSLNRSILDEIDAQINDTNINNKITNDNENTNDSSDKIVLEDLLSKESRIGLGSIEDYNFDS